MFQEACSARSQFHGAQILAAAFFDVFPHAKIVDAWLNSFSFTYEFSLEGSLESSFLPVLEDACRNVLKREEELEISDFLAHNAKAYFSHHGQDLRGRSIRSDDTFVQVYRLGKAFDFCFYQEKKCLTGEDRPVKNVQVLKLLSMEKRHQKNLGAIFRIEGVAASDKEELKAYLKKGQELKKCSRQVLAKELQLYRFEEGFSKEPFYLQKGLMLVKQLERLWLQFFSNYQELKTPRTFHQGAFSGFKKLKSNYLKLFKLKKEPGFYSTQSALAGLFLSYQEKNKLPQRYFEMETIAAGDQRLQALFLCDTKQLDQELESCLKAYKDFFTALDLELFVSLPKLASKKILKKLEEILKSLGFNIKEFTKKNSFLECFFFDRFERIVSLASIGICENFLDQVHLVQHSPFPSQHDFLNELLEHFQGKLPEKLQL